MRKSDELFILEGLQHRIEVDGKLAYLDDYGSEVVFYLKSKKYATRHLNPISLTLNEAIQLKLKDLGWIK